MVFAQKDYFENAKELKKRIIEIENSVFDSFGDAARFFGKEIFGADIDEVEAEAAFLEELEDRTIKSKIKTFAQNFHHDVHLLAKYYIQQFFCDKTMHCGGKIPNIVLFSQKRISIVINYDISRGINESYKALSKLDNKKNKGKSDEPDFDIKLVNETLKLIARSGVPQQFAGGILLAYLELVEGVEFDKSK